jgi:hypothetical protein
MSGAWARRLPPQMTNGKPAPAFCAAAPVIEVMAKKKDGQTPPFFSTPGCAPRHPERDRALAAVPR